MVSTHGHFDHVLGVKPLKRIGAKFLINFKDVDLMPSTTTGENFHQSQMTNLRTERRLG
ncbi:MAG: MBL fold metallo-hydrolase [Metallosphaera sp.]